MAKIRTHYDNLKVARNAPDSVIKAAYKALCQQYHPDKFQGSKEEGERIIKIVKASYEALIDPVKRKTHDRWIEEKEIKAKQQNKNPQLDETPNATNEQSQNRSQRKNSYSEEELKEIKKEKTYIQELINLGCKVYTNEAKLSSTKTWQIISKQKKSFFISQPDEFKRVIYNCKLILDCESTFAANGYTLELFGLGTWVICNRAGSKTTFNNDEELVAYAKKIENRVKSKPHNNRTNAQAIKTYQVKQKNPSGNFWFVGIVVILWVLFKLGSTVPESQNTPQVTSAAASNEQTANRQNNAYINHPELPLPQSGSNNANFSDGVAPLKIRTSPSGGYHYFVKIVNLSNNQPIGSYFIRSGESIDIKIPLGTYEIKYASGTKWQGIDYLFGSETTYSKAESTFKFSFDGYHYSGYTVELIMQQNGNLETSRIQPNQF
ncbi:J domain-containing protein [Methyloglobulus sp.]|uniref:J domain-containing protein n=1 Tax=Methyloglobulus sp. TaxID=2518622 RepID=UPI0032B81792